MDAMREIGLNPLEDHHGDRIAAYGYNENNVLQIKMDDAYFEGTGPSNWKSYLVYNAGVKTQNMAQYSYDLDCKPNETISFTLSTYHRQQAGWIIQYLLGMVALNGDHCTWIKIGGEVALKVLQVGHSPQKRVDHRRGSFPAPEESGIYFLVWPLQAQYSFDDALKYQGKSIGEPVSDKYGRRIVRLCVGMSYAQFCQDVAPFILKQLPEFETLLPALFAFISVRSVKKQ